MLGMSGNIPLFDLFLLLEIIIIISSMFLLLYFSICSFFINMWLSSNDDISLKNRDKDNLSLIYVRRGLSNTSLCLILGMIIYLCFEIWR